MQSGDQDDGSWEGSALATRYALGQMSPEEAAAFELRFSEDPAFREAYEAWVVQVSREAAEDPPDSIDTPSEPGAGIMARLDPIQQWLFETDAGRLAMAAVAGLVGVWFLLWLFLGGDAPDAPAPVFVAELAPRDSEFAFTASASDDPPAILVVRTAGEGEEGRVRELWLIPQTSDPVSLGLLDAGGQTRFLLPSGLTGFLEGGVVAVSDEPEGGSQAAHPSGPVVAIGAFERP